METVPRALSGRLSGESEHADAVGVLGWLRPEGTNVTQSWSPLQGPRLYSEGEKKLLGRL